MTAQNNAGVTAGEDAKVTGTVTATDGSASIAAGANADVQGGVTAKQDAAIAAANNAIVTGDVKATEGNATITATEGSADVDANVEAGQKALITANTNATVAGEVKAGSDATIEAGKDAEVSGKVTAQNNAGVTAGEDAKVTGNITATDGNASIKATEGIAEVAEAATVQGGKDVNVEAGDDAKIAGTLLSDGNTVIVATDDVSITGAVTAENGKIALTTKEGDVKQGEGSVITAKAGDINVDAAGDVTIDELNAGNGAVTIDAGGKVVTTDADGKDITGKNVTIIAEGGIGNAAIDENGNITTDGAVNVGGADMVAATTTGDNASIVIGVGNAASTSATIRAQGEDSDIIVTSPKGGAKAGTVTLDALAIDGHIVIDALDSSVKIAKAWALDNGEVNGSKDDSHKVILNVGDFEEMSKNAIRADDGFEFSVEKDDNGMGSMVLDSNGNVIITSEDGDIYDVNNDDHPNVVSEANIYLLTAGGVGEVSERDPFEVVAAGNVYVEPINGAQLFSGSSRSIWVFMRGESGDGTIIFNGKGRVPGMIYWNGMMWGGPESGMIDIDRNEGAYTFKALELAKRYTADSWFNSFLYFPTDRLFLDRVEGGISIEHILNGKGTIDIQGVEETIEPTSIDMNGLSDSFTWYNGDSLK